MTANSAIAIALRKRFPGAKGRRDLMRKLGLGLDDLAPPAPGGGGGSGGDDRLRALRVEIENALSEMKNLPEGSVAKILATLDKHVRLDKLPDDDPQVGAVRKITGDDEDDDLIARVKAFLKSRGLSDADADEAWRLAQAVDPAAAGEDRLPVSGPGGMHGYRSDRARGPGEKVFATDERKVAQAEELDRMFGTARVSLGLDYGGLRRPRPAVPVQPTTAAAADSFEKLFPDSARLTPR